MIVNERIIVPLMPELVIMWQKIASSGISNRGCGLNIRYAVFETVFGEAMVFATARGICGIVFTAECGRQAALLQMKKQHWSQAIFIEDQDFLHPWVESLLVGQGSVAMHLIGTAFQITVWRQLLKIPFGTVTYYKKMAQAIAKPNAARAVGSAIGCNPVAWIIPCHRVMHKSASVMRYRWGVSVKQKLLDWEVAYQY